MDKRYNDIIGLPHPDSGTHPRMPRADRAAQFAPFAALTGYDDAVKESARLTDEKIDPGEATLLELNNAIQVLQSEISTRPAVALTYFVPDSRKTGGKYVTMTGNIRKIDEIDRIITMTDNKQIPLDNIIMIEKIFPGSDCSL